MDQPEIQSLISDRVLVNGTIIPVTMSADGRLQWSEHGDRCLTLEKEVLGFITEGSRIRIKTITDNGDGICCVGSRESLVRKDFVFEPLSQDSLRLWCHKLREYIDTLGRGRGIFKGFIRMCFGITISGFFGPNLFKSLFRSTKNQRKLLVIHPKMEASFLENLDNRSLVSSGKHPTLFYQAFVEIAKWV